jgi:hypothetical protein
MSLRLQSWSSSSAASARRLLSRSSHQRLRFDAPPPPPIFVAAYAAVTNAPIDLMSILIFGFSAWKISIDTERLLRVQAGSLNRGTGTA